MNKLYKCALKVNYVSFIPMVSYKLHSWHWQLSDTFKDHVISQCGYYKIVYTGYM